MSGFLTDAYLWFKALHIIAAMSWMAGLLYLPRLFVYHVEVHSESQEARRFSVMERRLLRAIMNPAMLATYIFGVLLLATPGVVDWSSGWIWLKILAIGVLTGSHHAMGKWRKDLAEGRNTKSQRFFRIANEVPTIAMITIVIMVVVRPF
ncbi:MAG: protoporphyrinogen oxidase HemJ [Rhodospirillales bacterium]|jgi:putative membrane protein